MNTGKLTERVNKRSELNWNVTNVLILEEIAHAMPAQTYKNTKTRTMLIESKNETPESALK